jgi:hypothetical protein
MVLRFPSWRLRFGSIGPISEWSVNLINAPNLEQNSIHRYGKSAEESPATPVVDSSSSFQRELAAAISGVIVPDHSVMEKT